MATTKEVAGTDGRESPGTNVTRERMLPHPFSMRSTLASGTPARAKTLSTESVKEASQAATLAGLANSSLQSTSRNVKSQYIGVLVVGVVVSIVVSAGVDGMLVGTVCVLVVGATKGNEKLVLGTLSKGHSTLIGLYTLPLEFAWMIACGRKEKLVPVVVNVTLETMDPQLLNMSAISISRPLSRKASSTDLDSVSFQRA